MLGELEMRKLSPRQLKRMQSRLLGSLGLDVKELGQAEEVLIRFSDRELVIHGPNIIEMKIEGENILQVIGGEVEEREPGEAEAEERYEPSQDDILLVAAQAGVSEEEAAQALRDTEGDLAKAILLLKSRKT